MNNKKENLKKVILNPKIFIGMYMIHSEKYQFYLTTRIQKAYFLFFKEIFEIIYKKIFNMNSNADLSIDDYFISYNYGPYSQKLDLALAFYEDKKIIIIEEDEKSHNNFLIENNQMIEDNENWNDKLLQINKKFRIYKLNEEYIDYFRKTKNKISQLIEIEDKIEIWWNEFKKFVDFMNSNDINTILRYVYKKYPNFTKNSLIKDEVIKNE